MGQRAHRTVLLSCVAFLQGEQLSPDTRGPQESQGTHQTLQTCWICRTSNTISTTCPLLIGATIYRSNSEAGPWVQMRKSTQWDCVQMGFFKMFNFLRNRRTGKLALFLFKNQTAETVVQTLQLTKKPPRPCDCISQDLSHHFWECLEQACSQRGARGSSAPSIMYFALLPRMVLCTHF